MKVAYVFRSDMASTFQLATMILPQLEGGFHGVDLIGMSFFNDNTYCMRKEDPIGERVSKIAKEKEILLMLCDQCSVKRNLAKGTFEQCGTGEVEPKDTVEGVQVGCFPQLYKALSGNVPDQFITL